MTNPKKIGAMVTAIAALGLAACGQKSTSEQAMKFIDPQDYGVEVHAPQRAVKLELGSIVEGGSAQISESGGEEKYEPFYKDDAWGKIYGDVSGYRSGTAQQIGATALNNHPVGSSRIVVSYVNGVRQLLLNASTSLELLPKSQVSKLKLKCLNESNGLCLVELSEVQSARKEMEAKAFYTLLREQLESYNELSEEEANVLVNSMVTYVAEHKISLPAAPYSEILQLQGNLEGLDPHSGLITQEGYEKTQGSGDTNIVGMGANIFVMSEKLLILETFQGSGARAAGILPGDEIVSIDGVSLKDEKYSPAGKLNLSAAIADIKGKEGTTVLLGIDRGEGASDVEVTRKKVSVKNVTVTQLKQADHLQYRGFTADSAEAVINAADEIEESDSKAMIFDLRGNGGGSVRVLVEIVKHFLNAPTEPMFYNLFVRGGKSSFGGYYMGDATTETQKPMIVLIDANSASASEAVASNLKHLDRALVIGDVSLGKGSMQQWPQIPGTETYFRATTGLYYTAKSYTPQFAGVTPDVQALQMPHRPETAASSIRESDLPMAIPAVPGEKEFSYTPSEEKLAQVACAKDLDAKLKATYLKKAQRRAYPGDYQLQLAEAVVRDCL